MDLQNHKEQKSSSNQAQIHTPFRGYPDCIIYKDNVGAGRILVVAGEIQSTNHPDVQNFIDAIRSLLHM